MTFVVPEVLLGALPVVASVGAMIATSVGAFFLDRKSSRSRHDTVRLETLAEAAAAFAGRPSPGSRQEDDTRTQEWRLVQRLVEEYHEQALSQASVQFKFSVIAACAGFLIIGAAIVAALMGQRSAMDTAVQVGPGVIIEAVAALFFRQAGQTRERATALYDRLRSDRNRSDAIALVASIDNANVRNGVKAELVLHLAGLDSSQLSSLLPRLLAPDPQTLADAAGIVRSGTSPTILPTLPARPARLVDESEARTPGGDRQSDSDNLALPGT